MALELVAIASALSVVGGALAESYEGEPAAGFGVLLAFAGLALVAISARTVRHLRWRLVPYLIGAIFCWLAWWYIGVALVQFT
jgi:hypothetical protein